MHGLGGEPWLCANLAPAATCFAPSLALAIARAGLCQFFSTFQNTGTPGARIPPIFLRDGAAGYHWPRWMYCVHSVARSWMESAKAFCLAGSVSRANASRRFSISGLQGQPGSALSQPEFNQPLRIGSSMSVAADEVRKAFHPPELGGSFFALRATNVCQSIDCISTLNPACSISCLATGAKFVRL